MEVYAGDPEGEHPKCGQRAHRSARIYVCHGAGLAQLVGQEEHGEGEEEDVSRNVMATAEAGHELTVGLRLGGEQQNEREELGVRGAGDGYAGGAEGRGDRDKGRGAEVEPTFGARDRG